MWVVEVKTGENISESVEVASLERVKGFIWVLAPHSMLRLRFCPQVGESVEFKWAFKMSMLHALDEWAVQRLDAMNDKGGE